MEPARSTRVEGSADWAPSTPFVVTLEHAGRAFKCVRAELKGAPEQAPHAEQWVVTEAGRPVWSFACAAAETRASVQAEVRRWRDERHR